MGVSRILNLVEDREYAPGEREEVEQALAAAGIEETRLKLADYGHLPAEALEAAVTEVSGWLRQGALSYVHCRAGWQRSAAVAAGVVAVIDGIEIEDALDQVRRRSRRPSRCPTSAKSSGSGGTSAQPGACRPTCPNHQLAPATRDPRHRGAGGPEAGEHGGATGPAAPGEGACV